MSHLTGVRDAVNSMKATVEMINRLEKDKSWSPDERASMDDVKARLEGYMTSLRTTWQAAGADPAKIGL